MNHTTKRYIDASIAARRDSCVRSAASWRRRGRRHEVEASPGWLRARVRRPRPAPVDDLRSAA